MTTQIDSIKSIKNIGPYKDFSQNPPINFSQFNLFYGYNGCGKTTFTRILHCLNEGKNKIETTDGEDLVNYSSGEINISCNPTEIPIKHFEQSPLKDKIKIFNSDFIENNLQLNLGKAKKLSAILGEHNIIIKKEIDSLETQKAGYYTKTRDLVAQQELDQAQEKDTNTKRLIASNIRASLHIDNAQSYTIKHFEADLKNRVEKIARITQEDAQKAADIYNAKIKNKIEPEYYRGLQDIIDTIKPDTYSGLLKILETPIHRNTTQLKEEVLAWVEQGVSLHTENHSLCQFCGQNISDMTWKQRYAKIQELIRKDDDFEKQEQQLVQYTEIIQKQKNTLDKFSLTLSEELFVTTELFQTYSQNKACFDAIFNEFNSKFSDLYNAIEEKNKDKTKKPPFDLDVFLETVNKLSEVAQKVKMSIEKNNIQIEQIDQTKENNKKIVVNFYIQENQATLNQLKQQIAQKTKELESANQSVNLLTERINEQRALLENQEENIKRINKLLEKLLDAGLEFNIKSETEEYILERKIEGGKNIPARNLSEGEKNLIAFLYFIVSLESSSNESKKNEIIVIDDPVTSLDSNNLFVLQNLVVKTLKNYGQIFFLTHNFYFFAKIRDSINAELPKDRDGNKPIRIFEIRKSNPKGACIQDACKYVKKHISEYMSIMDTLIQKYKDASSDKDVVTGNLIRRVLEVFLNFKDTNKEHLLFNKLQKLAGDNEKYQSLLNLANAFSHTDEVGERPDFSYVAGKEEIGVLFKFMQEKDSEHFSGFGVQLNET